jgi:hypothetical protein
LKITNTKRAGGVAQGVGLEFKPQYRKKKKKKKKLMKFILCLKGHSRNADIFVTMTHV